ncbi:membrane protein insertase YidC [Rubinisphaera italica]|uniref:Membrane protein insertase YidC n=1 Tax=Rubinisphaera italica TaxID=2527969 RepID=A0A5C5XGZ5_9PLAN|nr:membrane protein insertase YidC [Rubinisphaera italica]TWT62446.1 Membrane protein insertase YidC [Rubinisphaera italica]
MDQQRRLVTFFLLSMGVMFLWFNHGLPFFFPELTKRKAAQQIAAQKEKEAQNEVGPPAGTSSPSNPNLSQNGASSAEKLNSDTTAQADPKPEEIKLEEFPSRLITLGSSDLKSKDYMQVDLTSQGAAVLSLQLNDPRYRELTDRNQPLHLLGTVEGSSRVSFDMKSGSVDHLLMEYGKTLETVNWRVDDASLTDHSVTFEYPSPDGKLLLRKTYSFEPGDPAKRDTFSKGYQLNVKLDFANLSDQPLELQYDLQGPVGFPLENEENTRRYLAIQAGFDSGSGVRHEQVQASEIAKQAAAGEIENFKAPLRYLGVDGQYFATLLAPQEDQTENNWIKIAQPLLLKKRTKKEYSQISFSLESNPVKIAPQQTVTQEYTLFAGPKRIALLQPFSAEDMIEYGWFGWLVKIMMAILGFFHNSLMLPYGIAIIMLTVMVRACMYPISRKHALAAKRMKELQPKFEEAKKKYENDKEKLAKAQMDLMKESGFFAGCLPMILQIPIFISLYQSLYISVDLRMAQFLWIDNLAAPDHLFTMPFALPWLGSSFNLLPMLTVCLFIVQQKMFAPPPANEEQALQQKMMGYMMIFIGFMFYKVPAGLCIYFIASSMWAIAERKILDFHDTTAETLSKKKAENFKKPVNQDAGDKKAGWLQNKMAALDAAANPSNKKSQLKPVEDNKKGKSKSK